MSSETLGENQTDTGRRAPASSGETRRVLDSASGDDAALRSEVESLIASHEAARE